MAKKPTKSSLGSRELAARGSADDASRPTDERQVIKHFQTFVKANTAHCRGEWNRAEENQRFAAGGKAQWLDKAWDARERSGRPTFTLNDCELAARAISGREMTARFEPTFLSRDASDAQWCNVLREVVRFIRQSGDAENVESDAFRDLAINNYSVVQMTQMFDCDDPHGRTQFDNVPLWECVWEAKARKICFTDRYKDARGYYVNIDEFAMTFPDKVEEVMGKADDRNSWVSEATRVEYAHPWSAFAERGQFVKHDEGQIFLIDYLWKQREPAYVATVPPGMLPHPVGPEAWAALCQGVGVDPGTLIDVDTWPQFKPVLQQAAQQGTLDPALVQLARPRLMKMDEDTWTAFSEAYAQRAGQLPDAVTPDEGQYRWAIHQAHIIGDKILRQKKLNFRHFPRIYMTSVPFKQITGTKMQSVIESMKDPQRFKNFVTTLLSSHLQRSQKMGMVIKPGIFEDENDAENRMSEPFFILRARAGASIGDDAIRFIDGAGFPAGAEQFLALADQAAWRGTGLNPNTLGNLQDPRRVSGTVFQALADAVMTVLSWEFGSLRTLRKIGGDLTLDFAAEYLDPDDLRDIVGPDKAETIPEKSEWRHKLRYDAVVEEVPVSKSEKEAAWDAMTVTKSLDTWIAQGIAPPWLPVVMMPDTWLPEEMRKKWLNWLTQQGKGPDSPPPPPPEPAGPKPPSESINWKDVAAMNPQAAQEMLTQAGLTGGNGQPPPPGASGQTPQLGG